MRWQSETKNCATTYFAFRVNLIGSLFLVGRAHWFAWIQRKTNKKKMAPGTDAITLSRPRPWPEVVRCNLDLRDIVQLLRMLQRRLRRCWNSSYPAVSWKATLLDSHLLVSRTWASVVLTTKTEEAARNSTTVPHGRWTGQFTSSWREDVPHLVGWRWTSAMSTRFFFFLSIAEELHKTSAVEKRAQHFRFMTQSPERRRTRSGRSAASSGRTAEVLRPVEERGSLLNGATVRVKTGEYCKCPTTGSGFAVIMSSPAKGLKGGNTVDGQLRGDWRLLKVLVDFMERRGLWFTGGTA